MKGRVLWDFMSSQYDPDEIEGVDFKRFVNPYIFEDGSTVSDRKWEDFSQLSWGVPVEIIQNIKEQNSF